MTLYNDNDQFCCDWLRNLIDAGHLPVGRVECEDIRSIKADDLAGFGSAHFFCGIGGWPHALSLARWPVSRAVWTGSCPCQPISCAGKRKGHADERHLWPAFYSLIAQRKPSTIFGEQVAGKDGREWLAGVRADLEGIGYAVGAADLCAASAGAPQIRQRLYWVASAAATGRRQGIAKACSPAVETGTELPSEAIERMGCATSARCESERQRTEGEARNETRLRGFECGCTEDNFWSDFAVIPVGNDWKRISSEPESFPLVARIPGDVAKLRAYGNALCVPLAVEFVKAVMDCL